MNGYRTLIGSLGWTSVLACSVAALPPDKPGRTAEPERLAPRPGFVHVAAGQLRLDGHPYRFVGMNLWYGAYLGAGDADRLRAELDLLRSLGVTNLRVLGASEDGPMKRSIRPAFRSAGPDYNEDLLRGLDVLLSEMAQRDMKAVIYLNNFWEWSGGMGTYLSWVNGGDFVDLDDPEKPWPAYPLFTMKFYESAPANALYRDYVKALLTRTNSITKTPYADDPTIMAWQLANEPRPGADASPGHNVLTAFYRWIDETAAFIKSLDPQHLVSTGNEGLAGCADHDPCFEAAHDTPDVDYLTFHMWPKNWRWLLDEDMAGTIDGTLVNGEKYMARHSAYATNLNKPLVLEEFGLSRDAGSLEPGSPTTYRDRFYELVFDTIERSVESGGPFVGSNAWAWGGLGRAAHSDRQWQTGDTGYTGDPPQEPQGLNSIFDVDTSTLAILRAHARVLGAAPSRE